MRWYSTGFVCPLLRSVYHRLLPISVLQQLDQIAPCAVVIDVGASAARHHPCRHAVYVCRARLQWIHAKRMCGCTPLYGCGLRWRLPSGVSVRRMKRCDTLRDVLSGAGGRKRGKGATAETGQLSGAPQRSDALFGFDAQARAARRAHAQVQRALVGGGPADQVHRAAPRRRAAMCNAIRVRAAPAQSHHVAPRPTRAIAVARGHARAHRHRSVLMQPWRVHRGYSGY